MKKNINFRVCSWFMIVLMSACQEDKEITLDLPAYSSKIVTNGELNNTENISVEISKSIAVLTQTDSTGYLLKDATAKLYENNVFIGNLTYANLRYNYNLKPVQGKTYKIEMSKSGMTTATVNVLIPNAFPMTSTFIDSVGLDNFQFPIGQLSISIQDNGTTNNYYQLSVRTYSITSNQWSPFLLESNDPIFINNTALNNGTYIFSDATFNGQNKTFSVLVPFGTVSELPNVDKFEVSVKTFSEEYYKYQQQVRDYNPVSNTFDTEPVLFLTNVTNGLGMVGGVYNDKDTIR